MRSRSMIDLAPSQPCHAEAPTPSPRYLFPEVSHADPAARFPPGVLSHADELDREVLPRPGGFPGVPEMRGNVEVVGAYMSVHDPRFADECAGSGNMIRLAIPFCRRCEA